MNIYGSAKQEARSPTSEASPPERVITLAGRPEATIPTPSIDIAAAEVMPRKVFSLLSDKIMPPNGYRIVIAESVIPQIKP